MTAVFEFLFKYRPVVFEKGRFAFTAGHTATLVAVAAAVLALLAALTYRRVGGRLKGPDRRLLFALRLLLIVILLAALLRPALLVSTAVPERNVVGVLLDDSRSMTIAEDGKTPRSAALEEVVGGPDRGLAEALAQRFHLRFFRVAAGASRVAGPGELRFDGSRSDLGTGLDDARRDLAALPLAGLVVVSDGADNADSTLTPALLALQASGIPVFTVGIGRERLPNDLELARVEAPRAALQGSSILVEALVRRQGAGRDSADLVVEEQGRILAQRRFALPGDGQATTVRVPVALPEAGPRELTVRLPPLPGETLTRNNVRKLVVAVQARQERILYYEGIPRAEFAFLRRAVAGDSNLQVVGLVRTAENKYLRLGVEDSLELIGGFPRTRDELFQYRGIVLGSVEAAAFTVDQLRMIADFVGRRGGGVLFLGGSRAFAEGGYRDTPLEEVMPVRLDLDPDTTYFRVLRVALTPAGRGHPITLLGRTGEDAERQWDSLPPLTSINRVGAPKPGAIELLTASDTAGRGNQVVFAYQRYGRGRAAALPVQDTWLWQMDPDRPADDVRFATFWRQLLRWLTAEEPDRVGVTAISDRVAPGEAVSVTADVRDAAFQGANGSTVTASVISPTGAAQDLPMDWVPGSDGQYRAVFTARDSGRYEVDLRAVVGTDTVTAEPAFALAGDVGREFFGAERRTALLRRIAEETGGRFYTPETVAGLPEDIVYTERGIIKTERLDLWDMPIVFLLIAALAAAEWSWRRARGLA